MINTLILDAGPLITQSFSELSNRAENFVTTPSVHTEIRDERARANLLLWGDRLKIRQPKPEFVKLVTDFSKKTGDYASLSSTDLHILALCYELECELNNGDWRLRKFPGENKSKKPQQHLEQVETEQAEEPEQEAQEPEEDDGFTVVKSKGKKKNKQPEAKEPKEPTEPESNVEIFEDFDENEEGWIGPEDDEQEAKEQFGQQNFEQEAKMLKSAMSTGDFAMQNVALQIGLNLVNPTNGKHIKKVKNHMLRCHACFKLCPLPTTGRPMQFCPKCGLNTLLRCSVSVMDNGKVHVHLKKNMQWITRGNKYSLPTPQSKNQRRKRQENNPVLLREDQKEYQKAVKDDMWKKRQNEKVLDEWIGSGSADTVMTPFAISGYKRDATRHTGVRIGRGRNANQARRKNV